MEKKKDTETENLKNWLEGRLRLLTKCCPVPSPQVQQEIEHIKSRLKELEADGK